MSSVADLALDARRRAYCPYSGYAVGAAIEFECGDGRIETQSGCNVENASYGLCICAERSAIFAAVATYGKISIVDVAVATRDGGFPCGACRQVISEFAAPNCRVICIDESGARQDVDFKDLLPYPFEPGSLD